MTDAAPMDDAAPPGSSADPLERASRLIEAKLFEPLTVGELADAAGLSPYHFSRQFTARFGQSVMAHVRARRIAAAAARLEQPSPVRLVDLAFDCGFDTQEGFTRAFKRAFGVTPGRFGRGERRPWHKEDAMTVPVTSAPALVQRPDPISRPAFRVVGLAGSFDEESKSAIPDLWDRMVRSLPPGLLSGRGTFGVCGAAEGEGMSYMAAIDWPDTGAPPAGLEVKDIPAQTYLVFRQVIDGGPLHPQMQAATREIWGHRLPQSGHALAVGPDLEVYPPDFRPDQAGAWVEWWVPVRS